jgi:hypothetical protein
MLNKLVPSYGIILGIIMLLIELRILRVLAGKENLIMLIIALEIIFRYRDIICTYFIFIR